MSESAAIVIYLGAAHPAAHLAPEAGSPAHAHFLQWMVFLSANLYETALRYYYSERYSTAGSAAAEGVKQQALADYARHLSTLDAQLAPYLLGGTYSAADAYLYMLAGWYPGDVAALLQQLPKLARHTELMRQRPAVMKSEREHAEPA